MSHAKTHRFKLHVLGSGSSGNCAIVEDATTGAGVMIDCGLCKRDTFSRAAECGFNFENLQAIAVTHDHTDHTKGLRVVTRGLKKLGVRVPLHACPAVRDASSEILQVIDEDLVDFQPLAPGEHLSWGTVTALPFATSHDAAASVGFRFECEGDALGYVTDTGILSEEALRCLSDVRILALESNHDPRMLANGPYPYYVKRRIASDMGHLSNQQAMEALEQLISARLEHVVAMHVSQNNNEYRLARDGFAQVVARRNHPAVVQAAFQQRAVSVQ